MFISNDLISSVEDIAALYKQRWQIELLFKWIKQNLKVKRFIGCSENAVLIQVFTAMIACLLLKLIQNSTPWPCPLQKIARLVGINLTSRRCLLTQFHPSSTRTLSLNRGPINHNLGCVLLNRTVMILGIKTNPGKEGCGYCYPCNI